MEIPTLDEFINIIKSNLDLSDKDKVTGNSTLMDLGMDSISAIRLITRFDKQFNVVMSPYSFFESETVLDLYSTLINQMRK